MNGSVFSSRIFCKVRRLTFNSSATSLSVRKRSPSSNGLYFCVKRLIFLWLSFRDTNASANKPCSNVRTSCFMMPPPAFPKQAVPLFRPVIELPAYLRTGDNAPVTHTLQCFRAKAQQAADVLTVHPFFQPSFRSPRAKPVHLFRKCRDLRHKRLESLSFNDYDFHNIPCLRIVRRKISFQRSYSVHFLRKWQHLEQRRMPSGDKLKKIFYESYMSHKPAFPRPCKFAA